MTRCDSFPAQTSPASGASLVFRLEPCATYIIEIPCPYLDHIK